MKRKQLEKAINKMQTMSEEQLLIFSQSFFQVDEKAKYFLNKAFDLRMQQLNPVSAMAEISDIDLEGYAR